MRRPVRSRVARRKLFQGGGLAPMEQPSGILASSQPLVDTIAQNAVNPNRTMSMNQGGTAQFNNGGANYFPGQKIQDTVANLGIAGLQRLSNVYSRLPSRDYLASYLPPALGGSPFEPQFDTIAPGGDGFRMVKGTEGRDPTVVQGANIDSTSFGDRIGVSRDFDWEVTDTSTGTVTMKDFTFNDMDGNEITAKNWFNETDSLTANRIFPFSEMFYSDTEGQRSGIATSPQVQQQTGVVNMKKIRPQDEQLITSISNDIIANNPEIGVRDLVEQVAVSLKDQKEGQNPGIVKIKREGAARTVAEPGEKTLAEILQEEKVDTDDIMSQIEDAPKKEDFPHELVKMAMDKKIESLIPQWRAENYSSEFIEKLQNQGVDKKILSTLMNRRQDLIANQDKSALDLAKMIQGDTEDDTLNMEELIEKNNMTKDDGEIVTEIGDGTETEDALQVNVPIPIPQKDDSGSPTTEVDPRVLDMNAIDPPAEFKPAIEAVKEAANTNNETQTATTLEEFRQEFIDAMPEYQGMTNDEKAFAWIKMGMSIAAGQSPNAITNISKGVLASLDDFADDPAQKRKYEMQVALSASKYALENVNNERTRLREFELNEQDLVMILNPQTNEQKTITKADLRAGNLPVGFMVTQDPLGDIIKLMNAERDLIVANTALIDAQKPDEITDKWEKLGGTYQDAALKVIDSIQSKTLLGPAIEMLFDPTISVVGLESGMKTVWNRVTNAIGLTDNDLPGKKEGEANEEYVARVQGVIAKKITAILGESNRTISTSDRDRADELAGVFANYWIDKTITDPDVLKIKIKNLWTTLDNDERQGRATMNRIIRDVGDLAVPGGKEDSFADSLMLTQKELFEGKPVIGEEGGIVNYFDMFDLEGNLLK